MREEGGKREGGARQRRGAAQSPQRRDRSGAEGRGEEGTLTCELLDLASLQSVYDFVQTFESYLNTIGLYYDLSSYALFGNIKQIKDDIPIENDQIIKHLTDFYNLHTEEISFVDESIKYLERIKNDLGCQIVVLSNLSDIEHKIPSQSLLSSINFFCV